MTAWILIIMLQSNLSGATTQVSFSPYLTLDDCNAIAQQIIITAKDTNDNVSLAKCQKVTVVK